MQLENVLNFSSISGLVNSFDSEKDLTVEIRAASLINKRQIVCLLSEWQEGQEWSRETDGQGLQGASATLELQSCVTSPRALMEPETLSRVLRSPDGWKWARTDLTGWSASCFTVVVEWRSVTITRSKSPFSFTQITSGHRALSWQRAGWWGPLDHCGLNSTASLTSSEIWPDAFHPLVHHLYGSAGAFFNRKVTRMQRGKDSSHG